MAGISTYVDKFWLNGGQVEVIRTYNLSQAETYPQTHGILVTDSRGRDFENFLPLDKPYNSHHVVCRGARIPQLQYEAIRELKTIPKSDPVVLYICGGGNELTYKEHHEGGIELAVHTQHKVLENILDFK